MDFARLRSVTTLDVNCVRIAQYVHVSTDCFSRFPAGRIRRIELLWAFIHVISRGNIGPK